jgi:hypothetical protein
LRGVVTAAIAGVATVQAMTGEVPENFINELVLMALCPVMHGHADVRSVRALVQDQDFVVLAGQLQQLLHVLPIELAPGQRAGGLVVGDGNDDG